MIQPVIYEQPLVPHAAGSLEVVGGSYEPQARKKWVERGKKKKNEQIKRRMKKERKKERKPIDIINKNLSWCCLTHTSHQY